MGILIFWIGVYSLPIAIVCFYSNHIVAGIILVSLSPILICLGPFVTNKEDTWKHSQICKINRDIWENNMLKRMNQTSTFPIKKEEGDKFVSNLGLLSKGTVILYNSKGIEKGKVICTGGCSGSLVYSESEQKFDEWSDKK